MGASISAAGIASLSGKLHGVNMEESSALSLQTVWMLLAGKSPAWKEGEPWESLSEYRCSRFSAQNGHRLLKVLTNRPFL